MGRWVDVAPADLAGTTVRVVDVEGVPVALFRLEDGICAIDDECSHDEASLAEGKLVGRERIECPRHGAQFDLRTGKNLTLPAVVPVKSYPTRVENNRLYVHIDD